MHNFYRISLLCIVLCMIRLCYAAPTENRQKNTKITEHTKIISTEQYELLKKLMGNKRQNTESTNVPDGVTEENHVITQRSISRRVKGSRRIILARRGHISSLDVPLYLWNRILENEGYAARSETVKENRNVFNALG